LTNSHPFIPEPLDMVTKEYSLENHTVQICDLSTDEIAKSNNWIGSNQVIKYYCFLIIYEIFLAKLRYYNNKYFNF